MKIIRRSRILVSGQMGIGNAILFTPFLRSLRRCHPHSEIAVYISKSNGIEEVYQDLLEAGVINHLLQPKSEPLSTLRKIWWGFEIGRRGWDIAIFRFNGLNLIGIISCLIGRIRVRVGHVSGEDWRGRFDFFINHPVQMLAGSHEVDRYFELSRTLGASDDVQEPAWPSGIQHVFKSEFRKRFNRLPSSRSYVVLVTGSSSAQSWKRWPEDRWAELIIELGSRGLEIVILGSGEEERRISDNLAKRCKGIKILRFIGSISLTQVAEITKFAHVTVSADSGIMHIAAAAGGNVIGIFGPTDELRTGPKGRRAICLRASRCRGGCYSLLNPNGFRNCDVKSCMKAVSAADVMECIEKNFSSELS